MMKLNEALGAILQDIAHARVQADMFSRDVSLEYSKDEILRLFPVPRAEIRTAEVELAFAVSQALHKDVNRAEIAAPILADNFISLRDELLLIPAKPSRARDFLTLAEVVEKARAAVEAQLDQRLKAALEPRVPTLAAQMLDDLPSFLKVVRPLVMSALTEVSGSLEEAITFGPQFSKNAGERIAAWIRTVIAAAQAAIDRAVLAGVELHLAVTKDELATVPPAALARVKLTVEVRNYEWVPTQDEQGRPAQKLVSQ